MNQGPWDYEGMFFTTRPPMGLLGKGGGLGLSGVGDRGGVEVGVGSKG